jgi:hypothetical protein
MERDCHSEFFSVGWAKPQDANASDGVPTIQAAHLVTNMVGTALKRGFA